MILIGYHFNGRSCSQRTPGRLRALSTDDQDLTLQIDSLTSLGINPDDIFKGKISGAKTDRPELNACLAKLQHGDTLVVWRLEQLTFIRSGDLCIDES